MSLFRVFDIASTGMSAQNARLNTTASNLANVDSVGSSKDTTYRAKEAVFASTLNNIRRDPFAFDDGAAAGVEIKEIINNDSELQMRYQPSHPKANEDGYIFMPNVDTVAEMANMISASRSYQTNTEVFQTAKTLIQKTLELGK
ncbi:MAG: flagellar basal body rod protein FlgC [Francisellaceae bacterium]|jgi:flagellar basal-body rod protein FlgC|nr:flagellar basal body rod protein FlgC [Francisellaceae bacterium]MBT6539556.1 flagellar basal body rod protein FlgC [Francisellaceae bacterium]